MLTEQELLLTKLSPSLDVWSSASDFFFSYSIMSWRLRPHGNTPCLFMREQRSSLHEPTSCLSTLQQMGI